MQSALHVVTFFIVCFYSFMGIWESGHESNNDSAFKIPYIKCYQWKLVKKYISHMSASLQILQYQTLFPDFRELTAALAKHVGLSDHSITQLALSA